MINKILNIIAILLLGWLLFMMLFGLTSCGPAKKMAKAEQLVLLNPQARHNIFLKELQLNPLKIDTITVYKSGINTVKEVPVIDSFAQYLAIRELQDRYTIECNSAVKTAYDSGVAFAARKFAGIKIPRIVDTVTHTIFDRQSIKLIQDSLTKAEKRIERTEQQVVSANENILLAKHERNIVLYFLIGVIAVSGGLLFKSKFI